MNVLVAITKHYVRHGFERTVTSLCTWHLSCLQKYPDYYSPQVRAVLRPTTTLCSACDAEDRNAD